MRCFGRFSAGPLALLLVATVARADAPSPLRLVPAEAQFLVQIHDPRRLVEGLHKLDAVGRFRALAAVKEQLDSTTPRRLRQLLAHFEKKLGADYPRLLDDIAGGGVAVAGTFGDKARVVLVVQGRDEARVEKFLAESLEVLGGELKRRESRGGVVKTSFAGTTGYKVGDFLLARIGATLVVANNKDAMGRAIGLHLGKGKSLLDHAPLLEAKKLLPASPLATAWVDMKPVHASPAGKALYASPRDDFQQTVLLGGILDVLGRSPFACAGLTLEGDDLTLSIRAPRGRDGAGPDLALNMGTDPKLGSRPLLEPKGVLFSSSFHLDLASLWTDRARLFPKGSLKGFEDVHKNSRVVFGGIGLGKVFEATAPPKRVVVVNVAKAPYRRQPVTRYPAFAFIPELRDPERFASAVGTGLRFGALALTIQNGMKGVEIRHAGHAITAYRFDEQLASKDDPDGVRFNFEPCFVRVGNQFVFCSRIDLCKELVDLLIAEQKSPGGRPESARSRFYASGLARLMTDNEDQLVTQAILDQAASPAEAKSQITEAIRFVESLGSFSLSTLYSADRFRYDIKLRLREEDAEARR